MFLKKIGRNFAIAMMCYVVCVMNYVKEIKDIFYPLGIKFDEYLETLNDL